MGLTSLGFTLVLSFLPQLALADVIMRDEGVALTKSELEGIVATWSPEMQRSAANDKGDRLELLNQVLMGKKIVREADKLTQDDDGYWELQQALASVKQRFMFKRHMDSLEMPDIKKLARERYDTRRDEYAKIPERRKSSHILLHCPSGTCERKPLREKAAGIVEELRNGADFEEMVALHSGDPGSKDKSGEFDRWIRFGEPEVTPPYSEALFEIEEVGAYSEPTDTQFGVHIIRLDAVREGGYRPFEEVREKIASDIYGEYRKLAIKEYRQSFIISDEAFIDGDAMERLFAPYAE